MKKFIFSVFAFGAFTFGTYAQTPDIKLGAKAGANFANITDGDMKTSFHVGVLGEVFFNDKFSIQPEILYSSQGSKFKDPSDDLVSKLDYTLDYINVPIMAKYYVMDGLSVQAGPQVGFLTKSEIKLSGSKGSETIDNKEFVNSIDFGLNFGIGYDLPLGLFFDARYNLGLTKVNKNIEEDFGISEKDIKQGVFQISVGYKF